MKKQAAVAASVLRLLADEMDEASYTALITAGTRPLIMMEVPQMAKQVAEMRQQQEQEEKRRIFEISRSRRLLMNQNMPSSVCTLGEVEHHDADTIFGGNGILFCCSRGRRNTDDH